MPEKIKISPNSEFFFKHEMTVSSSYPNIAEKINVRARHLEIAELLIDSILHPLRLSFGACHVESWLRDDELNKLVGGVQDSDHLYGNAVDITFPSFNNQMGVFKFIYESRLPIRQCIIYTYKQSQQLHVSCNIPGRPFKNEFFVSHEKGKYERWLA